MAREGLPEKLWHRTSHGIHVHVITISMLYFIYFNTAHVKFILVIICSFVITSAWRGRFIDEMCRRVHVYG